MGTPEPSGDAVTTSVSLNRPCSEAWRYLIDPVKIPQWWGDGVRLEPRVGGRFEEPWRDERGELHTTTGQVLALDEPNLLRLSWQEDDWDEPNQVTFRLASDGDRCRLEVRHEGWDQFDSERVAKLRPQFESGWRDLLSSIAALAEQDDSELPPIVHRTYIEAPPDKVYDMFATAEGWDSWFTQGTTIDPRPGGSLQLRWVHFGAGRWTTEDGGTVLIADPPRRFCFQWTPGSKPTTVDLLLTPAGSGTQVLVTESGYPRNDPDLKSLIDCAAGWGEALTLVKFFLEEGVTYGEVPRDAATDLS
ncbi:MAG: SRPBCC domain-containing protein [Acidobacteriota bacterium]